MNIAEVYSKFNKQLIILISGLSGTKKKSISEKIKNKFNLEFINLDIYTMKDYNKEVSLPGGVTIIDWDDIESYDWDSFNNDVNKSDKNLVICGAYFPTQKLKFTPDIHINIKISKQKLVENRHKYMNDHPDEFPNFDKINDSRTQLYIINNVTYPHYFKYLAESKINKTIDITESSEEKVYDEIFDYIIYFIKKFVDDNINKIVKFLDETKNDYKKETKNDYKKETKDDYKKETKDDYKKESKDKNNLESDDETISNIDEDDETDLDDESLSD